MNTDPANNANPNLGPPLEIAEFTNLIAFANASAAMEFLLSLKNGIKNLAMSLTECVTPEIHALVERLLFQTIDTHEQLTKLMIQKGWFHPKSLDEQFALDVATAERTVQLAELPLFKDRNKVLEAFDTPQNPN